MSGSKEVLNVGIDLGTSRSAVSASNGQQHVIESYVGWPVDMVARKVLKKDMLVGSDAVANRSMLDLRRPLERGLVKEGSDKDLLAVKEILNHLLHLVGVEPDAKSPTVRAVVGIPAEAMRVNKQHLRNALKGTVDALMIVSEPFAVAYGLDALLHSLVVDIGAGTTDFCVMRGRLPTEEDQRTLTTAGDSIDELLLKPDPAVLPRRPDHRLHGARVEGEALASSASRSSKITVTAPIQGRPTRSSTSPMPLRTACESLVEPIAETLARPAAPDRARVPGEGAQHHHPLRWYVADRRGFRKALQDALKPIGGGTIKAVKNPIFDGSDGGLAIALDALDSEWDKLGLTPGAPDTIHG